MWERGMSNIDPTRFKIQLEVQKEKLKNADQRFRHQEQLLAKAYKDLGQKEAELEQIKSERDDLRIKWEVLQRDFKHTQDLLKKDNQQNTKKRNIAKFQAFFASLIFLLSSVLVNLGTTMLTSSPPNSLGWVMMALAVTVYIVAALMTTLLALEGGNT